MSNEFYSAINQYYDDIFPLNKQQVEFVKREFNSSLNNLIEIGCANGKLTNALSEFSIMGVDLEPSFISIAKQRYPSIPFYILNMLNLLSLKKTFDGIITFGNTLVHLNQNEIELFLKASYEKLNANGKLLIQILNYNYILDEKIEALPLIENEKIKFVRNYVFENHFLFNTELTIKADGRTIKNSIELTPIRKETLIELAEKAGFPKISCYGSFKKDQLKVNSLPLIMVCEK